MLRPFYGAYFLTIIIVGAHDCDSPVLLEEKFKKKSLRQCYAFVLPFPYPLVPLKYQVYLNSFIERVNHLSSHCSL